MDGPVVRYGEREIPHDELRLQAARVAAGLRDAGVRHGDRVALVLRNDPTFLALSAACGLMGAVPVPVNWHWRGDEPEEFLRLVTDLGITHAQTVPTMFVRLLDLPAEVRDRYDLGSLECVVHAAAPCPAQVKRRIIEWFGPVIREYYGATEIGIVVVCSSDEWLAHEGTVGRTFGGSDIHVFDAEGRLLGSGETGEVFIRPPRYWPGFTYLGQDDKRREIERDGYISIGDVGQVDEDGYLYLSDRARDMVISGGVNIYPAEIEACLLELHGVRDVAVFGIPDESYGEALAAHVDTEPSAGLTEDDVRDHIRTRLAGYR